MIRIQKKTEQFNTSIFNGKFIVNKPVTSGISSLLAPYSNLFYWSHAVALDDCEFGLHPHEGFEIMTFVIEGKITHYDTASKIWTPLTSGDFQIIQSNSGIKHQERIEKGTRSFQIWFDPNFYKVIKDKPEYIDYHNKDFYPKSENEISTITYVGKNSISKVITPNLTIKKLIFDKPTRTSIQLNDLMSYTFYVLSGEGVLNDQKIEKNDAFRINNNQKLDFDFQGELFYIETPSILNYKPIWL